MALSIRRAIQREWNDVQKEIRDERFKGQPLAIGDILTFCRTWLKFKPTHYQERLLLDKSRFLIARWARQTGKPQQLQLSAYTSHSQKELAGS